MDFTLRDEMREIERELIGKERAVGYSVSSGEVKNSRPLLNAS